MVASWRFRLLKLGRQSSSPVPTVRELRASLMVRNRIAESLKPAFRNIDTLRIEYGAKQPAIEARLEEFRRTGREGDERLFEELCFCLIAIQSRARTSDAAVAALRKAELLWSGGPEEIAAFLRHRTRFHNHKATFIVRAREQFFPRGHGQLAKMIDSFPSSKDARGC